MTDELLSIVRATVHPDDVERWCADYGVADRATRELMEIMLRDEWMNR